MSPSPVVRGASAFTLVEVMIAMVILTAGILALAATSAGVARMNTSGRLAAGASIVAQARLERLRGGGCASLAGGTATTRSYGESWTVSASGSLRQVVMIVSYSTGRRVVSDTSETFIWCG